ncbi:pseudouridine synthase [Pseudomonas protegens]|uniref:YqcC family protein n=1 Tax=Pseudomonas protegens TaxID=380021 RepID=UPI0003178398|nr:YqcC family protein [Pseudomonas protegens]ROM23230.1 pseudouridine synthase [Pseudomonas protegens]ROM31570.1 pseudouridine synthase [Pseudomonas protegens]
MDGRFPRIAEQLLLIERELRVQGLWGDAVPSAEALASTQPFAVDTLEFEQWLQWIFLPRMKMILEQDLPLPNASGIQEMAEMVFSTRPMQGRDQQLRVLLKEFDQLIVATC